MDTIGFIIIIVVSVILGLFSAFGVTLHNVLDSNVIGEAKGRAEDFLDESDVTFH